MAIRRKRSRDEDMEAVPVDAFSDIAFLIIIFFILTTAQITFSGFQTDMPSGSKSEAKEETHSLQIMSGGQIRFNGDVMEDIDDLRKKLEALELHKKETEKAKVVMYEVAEEITWEEYFNYMAVISATGGNVAIVQQEED